MQRHQFQNDGVALSYLDAGGDGPVLIALHSHWMEGLTFAPLAAALAPRWRVVALDQRGHGHSSHTQVHTREAYLGDIAALYAHLSLDKAVLLGNSLGGVNAYQFAARHEQRVRALVIEDMDVVVDDDISSSLAWAGEFPTQEALAARIGPRLSPYLEESFRQTPSGSWRLAFDPTEMVISQEQLNGDHWADWLASRCPALLIRGRDSKVTTADELEQMATRRPHTRLVTLEGSHVLHVDNPAGFTETVKAFLQGLET